MFRSINLDVFGVIFSYLNILTDRSALMLLEKKDISEIDAVWRSQTKFVRMHLSNDIICYLVNGYPIRVEKSAVNFITKDIFSSAMWINRYENCSIQQFSAHRLCDHSILLDTANNHNYWDILDIQQTPYVHYCRGSYLGESLVAQRRDVPSLQTDTVCKFWFKTHNARPVPHRLDGPAAIYGDDHYKWYLNGVLHRVDGPAVVDPPNNIIEWRLNGKLHRLGGPALVNDDITEGWYVNGELHRLDGPAIIGDDGLLEWHVNGQAHRLDGPAIIYGDGEKHWYHNGLQHRTDGPATIYSNGGEEWYHNGLQHRMDGPAITYGNGEKQWSVNGILHRIDGPAITYPDGGEEWYCNGLLHRMDGPACITPDHKEWAINGQAHRLDGPAIIGPGKYLAWYVHDMLHRLDGPAVIQENGVLEWHINGKLYQVDTPIARPDGFYGPDSEQHPWLETHSIYNNGSHEWRVGNIIHRSDGPAVICANGDQVWLNHGLAHRSNGPAVIYATGKRMWCINGRIYRSDGPAIQYPDGGEVWVHLDQVYKIVGPINTNINNQRVSLAASEVIYNSITLDIGKHDRVDDNDEKADIKRRRLE